MQTWIRSRLTYANVMVTALAFVVLGGSAYAASQLAANSVGTKQLKDDAVKRAELADGAVGGANLGDGAVAAAKLGDGAVTQAKLADGAVGAAQISPGIPAVRVTSSANQSIPHAAFTNIAFDTESYDTANMHDNTTNNHRLVAPIDGVYQITGQVEWAANGTGGRDLAINSIGGSPGGTLAYTRENDPSGPNAWPQQVTSYVKLTAGTSVYLTAFQTTGGALNTFANSYWSPVFSMTWVAPG